MNSGNITVNFFPPFETSSTFSDLTPSVRAIKHESMFDSKLIRFGFTILLLTGCSPAKKELPRFSSELECSNEEIPIWIQPSDDVKDGNDLEIIYCNKRETPNGKRIELSLVFRDERHPSFWKDAVYRIYRGFKYGRHKDIESLRLQFSNTGELSTVHLKNVYSGDQKFSQDPVQHFDSVLKADAFSKEEKKPILYINTWNHMFSEKDQNPELSKKKFNNVELRTGSREELDAFYSGK
ncbi:surface adhesion protein Lsa23 [Leptospira kmetyi]|uniref:Lipoprotein n=1 Tax=Leptospira kmetyi TaxID=408139 RepID=A0ABX4NE43_9LEPT|nr:hypothetical protein [Leptospira kmetyi]PJZ31637.1 hypothetical protein CH378_01835 [Leptospira kmetyi]TGL71829.1 hypothetical protein EHQ67_01580 [Leptospira kmetyi]